MEKFQTISPVDGSVYYENSYADSKTIDKTLQASVDAWKNWKQTSIQERAEYCKKALVYFLDHAQEMGEEITWQMGRPIRYTPFEIRKGFKERAEYMISIAEDQLQDIVPPKNDGFERYIRREALGTILVLAPWNYPYLTSVNVIIPALMAGNTVILKHAIQTPLCAERYAKAFEAASLPKGVFQYFHISHPQVAEVIQDSRIAYVAFTGSVEGGKAIQEAAHKRFMYTGLELGGKDPAYVRADANLSHSIENLVDGAFFNSGQSCCGIERIYVHENVYDAFVEGAVELTKSYVLDNPLLEGTTIGPMVRTSAANFAQNHIDEAVSKGANLLIDRSIFAKHKTGTPYMAPQILVDVDHTMQIMTEETFAPVVGIMKVKDDHEALQLMNDSRYGLTASIWSQDVEAVRKIAEQVETGTCFMNRCDYLDPQLAWTGVKDSGKGCTLSSLGYEALTRPKSYHFRIL